MFSLKINDVEISDLVMITNVIRNYTSRVKNNIKTHLTMHGGIYKNTKIENREIEVQFIVLGDTRRKADELCKILYPGKELNIIFGDQKDRFYIGRIDGIVKMEKITNSYERGSFTILCTDPFAYSIATKQVSLQSNKITFNNAGIFETYPTFEFTAPSNIRKIALVHPIKGAFIIGEETGDVVIAAGTRVQIDFKKRQVILGGNKRLYEHVSSKIFSIEPGTTEIGVLVNAGATIPNVTTKYREVFL
ncbi:phage tail family protein [Carnobacteriaceae bacterium zg-ZUI240]|nr:phage tail family protein [Carnobacteriaceae bacterium zg-ZUI240]